MTWELLVKKKKKVPMLYHKIPFLKLHQGFWNQHMRDFLESMCHSPKDATEKKVDLVSAVI